MIRLELRDLGGPSLERLAAVTNLSPEQFRARFLPAVQASSH
jgi:hypothetical protein